MTEAARVPTTTTPTKTTYRTRLERNVAQAYGAAVLAAFLAKPAPPTLSQIPPRVDLLVPTPPTVCTQLRPPGLYRCGVGNRLRSGRTSQIVNYVVHLRRHCFTATTAAVPANNALHRLKGQACLGPYAVNRSAPDGHDD